MTLTIVRWPDPILLTPCGNWVFDTLIEPNIEQDLIDTMMSENAAGLAANQVGIPYRVLAMNVQAGEFAGQQLVMYNPKINSVSTDLWEHSEGCLSFPGVWLPISRPYSVVASWQDKNGLSHSTTFIELDAKCFLHEMEHLDGKVFKEHVSDLKFNRAVAKARKK